MGGYQESEFDAQGAQSQHLRNMRDAESIRDALTRILNKYWDKPLRSERDVREARGYMADELRTEVRRIDVLLDKLRS